MRGVGCLDIFIRQKVLLYNNALGKLIIGIRAGAGNINLSYFPTSVLKTRLLFL